MKGVKNVSIIIPVYIPDISLVGPVTTCLESLSRCTPTGYELVVVDDGSPIRLAELHQADVAIFKKTNGGFTPTVNLGIKNATRDIFVIANDDLTFRDGWLEALVNPIITKEASITALRTTDEPLKSNKFGSIWAISRALQERMGFMNEKFPHYFSDLDYQKRLRHITSTFKKIPFELEHVGKATYRAIDPTNKLYWESATKYKEMYGVLD